MTTNHKPTRLPAGDSPGCDQPLRPDYFLFSLTTSPHSRLNNIHQSWCAPCKTHSASCFAEPRPNSCSSTPHLSLLLWRLIIPAHGSFAASNFSASPARLLRSCWSRLSHSVNAEGWYGVAANQTGTDNSRSPRVHARVRLPFNYHRKDVVRWVWRLFWDTLYGCTFHSMVARGVGPGCWWWSEANCW